ncbi:MAG TPA: hypothetical protein VF209_00520, partial [Patescibacteria group bacterium]
QKVGTSAKELQQLLRSAQIKARAGQRPDTCDKLVAYSVEGAAGGSTIQLYAQCLNGVTPAEVLVQSLQLQNGVMLSQALNIEYKTLHGGVEGFGTVQLDSNYGQSFSFAVDAGGAISEGAFDAQ